uniref:RNA-directed DNA polymerase, eukaryota, reverse transcriptase zinc-binding domain protein n=1 Tax=Tanacetum cinerariifolium TaxID=118510 RepID=A0A6L2M6Z8_TANCI|nr:hypothetical protein [Tanacetum cinerariifolium]
MGDEDWQEVNRKNRRSVFDRLKPSLSQKSNVDDLVKISLSVYVSNFPSHLTVRELWNICGKMGTLVDVYIAKRKNKIGQMFAFCRYIKVSNSKTLIDSLANTWIGKLRLHANVARFHRNMVATTPRTPCVDNMKGSYSVREDSGDHNPEIDLSHDGAIDFSLLFLDVIRIFVQLPILALYADLMTWFSSLKPWHDDFLVEERLVWLEVEGVPIHAWDNVIFRSICNKWGDMLFSDDSDTSNRLREDSNCDDENYMDTHAQVDKSATEKNVVDLFGDILADNGEEFFNADVVNANVVNCDKEDADPQVGVHGDDAHDSDPFELEPLINMKASKVVHESACRILLFFHLAFRHNVLMTIHSNSLGGSHKSVGFSLVERLEETIEVGLALGLNMEGCECTLAALITNNGDLKVLRQVWGNNHFDFASTSARGMTGGIVCIWNDLVFKKSKILCNENYVDIEVNNWDVISVTMGDFNEVREAGERFGSFYNDRQADLFNNFISNASLIDVPLGGYKFTWTDKWGSKMNKIDRFLVSELFYETFPNISGVILEKAISDHRPILIKDYVVDLNDGIVEANDLISFKKKPQNLKRVIREWVALQRSISLTLKKDHLRRLFSVDTKFDQGLASKMDLCDRCESIRILGDLDKWEASDITQKSRTKWALEGDENSNFFHASLKKSRRRHSIKDQSEFLERDISWDEIKRAVWDCGSDRASEPYGFTFKFFTSFWELIEADVCRFAHEFFSTGAFPKGCNSSFIALIPKVSNATLVTDFCPISLIGCQYKIIGKILANRLSMVIGSCISPEQSAFIKDRNILDGPLVLSEMMAWHRKNKRKLMIFKVDFEKAFDFLKWDFLDLVMDKIGFGCRWRSWIKGCLRNARATVLVNGSPTKSFRGLKQGDLLSPFLFILAMKGLHAFIYKAMNMGNYKSISIGDNNLRISHLMYVDDVIFMGEWLITNAHNLLCILRCFFLVSGLKINVHKSNLSGVGMSNDDIQAMAIVIGCGAATLAFKYLGILAGCNMLTWERKKITWVRWKRCLASKNMGRLGIGSIFALNVGLLFNWIWRFLCNSSNLWIKVIKEMYGFHGGIFDENMQRSSLSPWCGILSSIKALKNKGIDLLSLCSRKLGNGVSIRFWDDVWWGDTCLKSLFSRVYLLDTDRSSSVANRVGHQDWGRVLRRVSRGGVEETQLADLQSFIVDVVLSDQDDSWSWAPNVPKGFSVASVRSYIDLRILVLPSRVNLDRRGIDVHSVLYPVCLEDVETVNHLFFTCDMASQLWVMLANWWAIDIPLCTNLKDWFIWLDSSSISFKVRIFLEGVGGVLLWSIWCFRNQLVFPIHPPKKAMIWDYVVSQSFLWISSRSPKVKISWLGSLELAQVNLRGHKGIKFILVIFEPLTSTFEGCVLQQKQTAISLLLEDATLEAIRIRAKWENDDYICRGHILNGMSDSLFDVYTNVESAKELWDSLESKYMAEDSSSKKFLVSNFNNYKMVDSRPVIEQYNELLRIFVQYTQHGLKMNESISISSITDKLPPSWKDFKHTSKHGKDDLSLVQLGSHLRIEESLKALVTSKGIAVVVKRTTQMLMVREKGLRTNPKTKVDAIAWWIDSGATTHVCKDRCWFMTFEPVEDGSVLYMGDEHCAPVHGKERVALDFSSEKTVTLFNVLYVPKLRKNLVSGPVLNKCGYKQVYESDKYILSKCDVFVGFGYYNNGMFMLNLNKVPDDSDSVYMSSSYTVVNTSLWHARLGHVHYKRILEMSKDDLIPAIDEKLKKYTTCMLTKITRKPFKSITRKSVILELIHSDLCDFHATPSLGNKKYVITFIDDAFRFCYVYLLHAKDEALDKVRVYKTEVELQQNDLIKTLRTDIGCGAVVRLSDPKRKTLGEKGTNCIFVGYAEHFKAYRFYVIEPNDPVSINSIIESRDVIFDENRFYSIPRPNDIKPNSDEYQRDDHSNDIPSEISEPRKEAINDEIGSIMENNTLVLSDLPPSCKPLGCKWIFKKKMKVDGTIDKFKARLVIQGFRQKEGIDYFDTYALVARITTLRLLLALAAIHNLVIHQMDVKTTFLNGELDEVYMKQPEGFVMRITSIVDKTKKFLSSRFSMKDMEEVDVILGIKIKRENKGIVITPSHYIEKILKKFNREDCSRVFLLGGGAILWASKKQICITGSTMESEFVALAAAGKKAE